MTKRTDVNTEALVIKKYLQDEIGSPTIAKELGINKKTVLSILNRYNIKKRTHSQATKNYFEKGGKHGMQGKIRSKESIAKAIKNRPYIVPWTTGLKKETSTKLQKAIKKAVRTRNPSYISYDKKNGYMKININGKRKMYHRHIWEQVNGPIPKGYVIHHRDEDKLNNNIQNLQMMKIEDHTRLHMVKYNKKEVNC